MRAVSVDEQMDAYTSFRTGELFKRHGIDTIHTGLFTSNQRDTRELFTFTRDQLVKFLRAHPERVELALKRSQELRGTHDKEILEPRDAEYILYSQDRGKQRDEHFYIDRFEAAADWFTTQYRMWLREEV
jgi:hypothetical protein